ncbi:MAG: glycosyltransferase [Candidatus Aenigmarchaeota archaeon]|nr:glycosyltransferase [Candidatus Aenigmarchaeota archaeon]
MKKSSGSLISIITPTYNRSKLLKRAIRSVLNQNYHNFEMIVVDGGSTDGTEKMMKSIKDKRIRYVRQKKNCGLLSGKNLGLDKAKGEYACFLDDDDELLPDALSNALWAFREIPKDVNMVWLDSIDSVTRKTTGHGVLKNEGYINYRCYLCGRIYGEFWPFFKRKAWGKERFDERLWGAEGHLLLRMFSRLNIYYVPRVVRIYYQDHGGNVCRFENQLKKVPQFILNNQEFLREFGAEQKAICPKAYGKRMAILGFWQLVGGDKKGGRETLREALKYNRSAQHVGLYLASFILSGKQIAWIYGRLFSGQK